MKVWNRDKKIAATILAVTTVAVVVAVVAVKIWYPVAVSRARRSNPCVEFPRARPFSRRSNLFARISGVKPMFGLLQPEVSRGPSEEIGPVNLEGVIQKVTWHSPQFIRGIPMMSGTLGRDRTIPARYKLEFQEIEVSDLEKFRRLGCVVVYHPQDDGFLIAGMRIRIDGLTMSGDEGGDYIFYDRVEILDGSVE